MAAENQVLQRTSETDVLLAAARVDRARVPGIVEEEVDGFIGDLEGPWLGVVRACGEDRTRHCTEGAG